jgi:hypothetical protein
MKNQASTQLQQLFVELVKIELSNYKNVTSNMLSNTIQFYANMNSFSMFKIEFWHCVASANNIKFNS